MHKDMLYDAI
jgi:L-asparaginase